MAAKSPFRRIALMVDGSDAGLEAAKLAVAIAGYAGAELCAISVVDTATLKQLLSFKIMVDVEMAEYEGELEASARKHLDYVEQLAGNEKIRCESVLASGDIGRVLLAELRQRNSDLLVMGGFTASMAKLDLLAKAKQTVLDDAPCPVMVIKS
jgi:nucleotide-binding universal stress UspA family protein